MEDTKNPENNQMDSQDTQSQIQTVEIDGEQVTLDELKKGYMRQSDYTKKTTEVAQQKQEVLQDAESIQLANAIKELGFSTKEEVETYVKQATEAQKEELKFNGIIEANPEIAKYKDAIETIRKTTKEPVEDIIEKYGFGEKDKLRQASLSRGNPGGNPTQLDKGPKSVGQMSDSEYEKWRSTQGLDRSTF